MISRSLHALVLALATALPLAPSGVFADGCFVWRNREVDVLEPQQKAFIVFEDGVQDLVLSVKFAGAPEEFGWIVPLPAVPEMFEEHVALFEILSKATQDRDLARSARARRLMGKGSLRGAVEIVKQQAVGPYDVQILKSDDGSALGTWLESEGYPVPEQGATVFDRYVRDGWVFAAMKIRPGRAGDGTARHLPSGTIEPIRFRFPAREPVFPLEISSLNPGGSEVLLYVMARELLVPRPSAISWDTRVFSRGRFYRWFQGYLYEHRESQLFPRREFEAMRRGPGEPDDRDPGWRLSKCRANVQRAQMKDVFFDPFDPAAALHSAQWEERAEALTYLGHLQPPEARRLLADHQGRVEEGQENHAYLWALGQVGGEWAVRYLVDELASPEPEVRLEVIEALSNLESREALPHLVAGLERPRLQAADPEADPTPESRREDSVKREVQKACLASLARQGDPRAITGLEILACTHDGPARWKDLQRRRGYRLLWDTREGAHPGILAVAALAACGDEAAADTIIEAIVTSGTIASATSLRKEQDSGSVNGFPIRFWTGLACQNGELLWRWKTVAWAHELLGHHPKRHDEVFRQAASHPDLPVAGSVVLLANLMSLQGPDVERLRSLFHAALREPLFVEAQSVRYNVNACGVAYALARHGRSGTLQQLYSRLPDDDPELRGEIAAAMARTGDPGYRDEVLDHVRRRWRPRGASATAVDVSYRQDAIAPYLRYDGRAAELYTDRSFTPGFRLFWIMSTNAHASLRTDPSRERCRQGIAALDALAADPDCPEHLRAGIPAYRQKLELRLPRTSGSESRP